VYDDPDHPESELTFVFTSGKFNATAEWDNPDPSKATDALFHFFSLPHTGCQTWSSNATAAPCKACGCPDPLPNPIPPEAVLVSEHEATQVWYVNSSAPAVAMVHRSMRRSLRASSPSPSPSPADPVYEMFIKKNFITRADCPL
jgi:hypothetical protein